MFTITNVKLGAEVLREGGRARVLVASRPLHSVPLVCAPTTQPAQ